jgi:hypothetical protein
MSDGDRKAVEHFREYLVNRRAVERVRAVLETEAVVGRSALEYRGLIASALMADAAAPAAASAVPGRPDSELLPDRLEAVLTERFTELGNPYSEMRRQEQGPDGWPASHPVGPRHVAEVLRELLAVEQPAAGAQPKEAQPSPTEELLATRCDACRHTLARHHQRGACTVVLCVCGTFQHPVEELPQ